LVAETFGAYWDLLDSVEAIDPAGAGDWTARAAILYSKRGKDSYYAGGIEYEGGGPDNRNMVDFRLARYSKLRRPGAWTYGSRRNSPTGGRIE
jgi:hypothetical protein